MEQQSPAAIKSWLEQQDSYNHLNLLNFMENNRIHRVDRMKNSVILRGESDRAWVYIVSPDERELNAAAGTLTPADRCFAAVEDWMVPILSQKNNFAWHFAMVKLVLPVETDVPPCDFEGVEPLDTGDTDHIYENSIYREVISPEYVRDRIERGLSGGIRDSGKLAAWIMTHDDLAIGFLHVLEPYRGQGFAKTLTSCMIHRIRLAGKIPFVHIEETNTASMQLAKRTGFRPVGIVHWFEIA